MTRCCRPRAAGWLQPIAAAVALLGLSSCHRDMRDQPRYEPYELSTFFADRRSERPIVPNTVARGHLDLDSLLYAGVEGGKPAVDFPFPLTYDLLKRGQERFNIYCTPCHDRLGTGQGMIVQRGLKRPPSFHIERLRNAPPGYFFDVITRGFGVMYDYSVQIRPEDRWAIIGYIRALQLSQDATLADVPATHRADLDRNINLDEMLKRPLEGWGPSLPPSGVIRVTGAPEHGAGSRTGEGPGGGGTGSGREGGTPGATGGPGRTATGGRPGDEGGH